MVALTASQKISIMLDRSSNCERQADRKTERHKREKEAVIERDSNRDRQRSETEAVAARQLRQNQRQTGRRRQRRETVIMTERHSNRHWK